MGGGHGVKAHAEKLYVYKLLPLSHRVTDISNTCQCCVFFVLFCLQIPFYSCGTNSQLC